MLRRTVDTSQHKRRQQTDILVNQKPKKSLILDFGPYKTHFCISPSHLDNVVTEYVTARQTVQLNHNLFHMMIPFGNKSTLQ